MTQLIHRRMIGDTLTALDLVLTNSRGPVDLTGLTAKYLVVTDDAAATSVVSETTTGVTAQPTQDFTVSTTLDRVLVNGHGLRDGDQIVVATSGTLPTGLAASTRYYVVNADANTFQVSSSARGAPIDITAAGSGTHTLYLLGHVKVALASAATTTAGRYRLWVTVYSGSSKDGYPNNKTGLVLEVVPYGG